MGFSTMAKMKKISELMSLTGRKALVTGGKGHIGKAVCEALEELGSQVKILDLPECDLRDEIATREFARKTITEMGGLDILIHCAAYVGTTEDPGWSVPFEKQTVKAWDAALRVNVTSAFVVSQECQRAMAHSGHGSIIFLSSIYGMVGPDLRLYSDTNMVNPAGYNASKGGILQLARYLATVFAPHIRVNAVSPGGVWRGQPEVFQERYVQRTPLKRMATEEDLKGAVAFLASDLSQYVTGHNLVVDGGFTIW